MTQATIGQRFFDQVCPEPNTGCWLWLGLLNGNDYGVVRCAKRRVLAHRLSWEIHHGAIPTGMQVCHSCDVKTCVCPAHLWLGTNRDNVHDMISKARSGCIGFAGERHPSAKLTAQDVSDIRALKGTTTTRAAAQRFGVGHWQISRIWSGKNWRTEVMARSMS